MSTSTQPDHFVVDGSNIATEGRSTPSLEQLNEAVMAFLDEHPSARVTVVVDATFGHRIGKNEVKEFDEAVANNELVTPPAGAVGRGDAFVLTIAHKAGAGVLSNDSFQEFHGDYDWLFDEGRLIGGKPVPHVGWVFVDRNPVRGPKSRKAVRDAKQDAKVKPSSKRSRGSSKRSSASNAEQTDDSSKRTTSRSKRTGSKPSKSGDSAPTDSDPSASKSNESKHRATNQPASTSDEQAATPNRDQVNDAAPFFEFAEHHPVGTSCTGVVETYASHGAYATVGDVRVYIPLRLMDDPTPRSARSVLALGDAVTVVIVGYVPERRSIDAALPQMASVKGVVPDAGADVASGEAMDESDQPDAGESAGAAPKRKPTARRSPAKKSTAKKTAAKKSTAKKSTAKKTAAKTAPKKTAAAEKAAAKKAPAKRAVAKKTTAAKTAASKKSPARKTTSKKAATKKAPSKKAAPKKAPARRSPAKKTAAKKTAANKTVAKRSTKKQAAADRSDS